MRSSVPATVLSALAIVTAAPAIPGPLDEPHLPIVPRTAEEAARIAAVTAPAESFDAPQKYEERSAGAATVRPRNNADAFSQPSANIGFDGELEFKVGNGLFRKLWVSAPASTQASDGLGPIYNARSCQRCHLKDGRGHPPEGPDDSAVSMFLRISIPGGAEEAVAEIEDYLATAPDPNYGTQLQDFGLPGIPPEYTLRIDYEETEVALSGGEIAHLREPSYTAADLGYGPLHPDAMLSPRVAPQMIGMGLLEAIPAADILANADPEDADGDGISGRPNIVMSHRYGIPMLGRFGWKAGNPTVEEQTAAAFVGDIGISNPLHTAGSGECTDLQADCLAATHGDGDDRTYEIDQQGLDLVTFYSRNLAVPARRDVDDPEVLHGKRVFHETGCISCHTPSFVTHRLEDDSAQSFQLIWPYSDMLLHDMGDGLADHRPEARADGYEWRTPPLWGIGMTERVSGHTYFLHDGRARSLLEAILWHGGEAQAQRDAVARMPPEDRAALITFLESL
ncbi:di-heme oxidoredictase family protein [Psychromarinibacter sp. C21-152]|uniref:Di-heme oxidoredictase family protein n=1 Tax=Psychromarinibacter sediminicola TaxID=3033385 RepID=A0AAE3NW52_9RHOB|nr:di-heme oxidoredictase family protein [Psychromarinibacter sediminicola]MDF0603334.1 di-heme oxidoredictase family protein [Psychromarinibacter sediminicola]